MRFLKIIAAVLILQFMGSCQSKSPLASSLDGNWKIISAVGNDNRHWNGSFTLKQDSGEYKGLFQWDAVDGKQTGTDSIKGQYDAKTRVLTMRSIVISGNIESVVYMMNVSEDGKKMEGTWTGSSDGTVDKPGRWAAEKE